MKFGHNIKIKEKKKEHYTLVITQPIRVCISDVREEGGLATLNELREKFGDEKVHYINL